MSKDYKAVRIPNRGQMPTSAVVSVLRELVGRIIASDEGSGGAEDTEPFVQIEIEPTEFRHPQSVPKALPKAVPKARHIAEPLNDEKKSIYRDMRKIASNEFSYSDNDAKTFYSQAVFMKDFVDDYDKCELFFAYYPSYQAMSYGQLRTYFTWRGQIRRGNVMKTSVSYAFVYIYELLNNIGVTDPNDGLEKLMNFWLEYRNFDTSLDYYMRKWLKDYHVYYTGLKPFREFILENKLESAYPSILCYESGVDESLAIFSDISIYKIKRSKFYSDETRQLINDCFYFILNKLRELCKANGKIFEDFVYTPSERGIQWIPFKNVLFYNMKNQNGRSAELSPRESYTCRHSRWTYKPVISSYCGKQLISYIMRAMEVELRKILKYKYKMSANIDLLDIDTVLTLESLGIVFPDIIQVSTAEFYAQSNRTEVSVDLKNLEKIRREALDIQEKLIVPEVEAIVAPTENTVAAPPEKADVWENFAITLTDTEFEALALILANRSIKAFVNGKNIMPEILIDGLNQKAADSLGDIILEFDGNAVVYDDYREKLTNMVKSNYGK
jgi:hypothetical protein